VKREIPILICFITGIIVILEFFIPHPPFDKINETCMNWVMIISGFAMLLGIGNLIRVNFLRISRQTPGWGYNLLLIISIFIMPIAAYKGGGIEAGTPFNYLYMNVYIPLSSTMFSLLAFFIASAAFRAFKARTKEATLLLVAAFLVMLGRVPIGQKIWKEIPHISTWIMNYFNTAGQRAIMIGAALGVISVSIKILLGIERTYMGGE